MSDPAAEATIVSLTALMAEGRGFRPLHFGAPTAAAMVPIEPAATAAEPAEDPFARGLAEGQRLAEAAFAIERDQLLALVAGAEALQDEPSEELAQLIAETVERLVRQIVGQAPIDAEWLQAQADIAATMVAEADKARTLWVNPADAALLMGAPITLPIEADPSMMRGTVRIETSAGWIEHGRAVYLGELRAALGGEDIAA
ncbi:flagellar biosynthetic protein [Sphingopyxis lindanitolerans]|uniref:Flagellar biosynthetic protein n=1 Tax=Sphingopyxis lindanitolerans TaxID=2054227 RepID=A0A2S8B8V3_9SPHN|nr:FliH/SctL family protein [Sphingopyxis lindanitolerans]PQM28756.1 flagellar biosynthetic protein [Sphingopyxis lindanitolerans]